MAPSTRFRSSTPQSEIEWAESVGDRRFVPSRSEDGSYWTETRDLKLIAEAATSGGVVTTSCLRTCAASEPATRAAVRRGLLTRWSRGIYLAAPDRRVTEHGVALAAVGHGVLGSRVAARLARFASRSASTTSVPARSGRSATGSARPACPCLSSMRRWPVASGRRLGNQGLALFTALQAIDEPAPVTAGIATAVVERRGEAPTGIEPV
jgi:hypothetical protein